MPIRPEVLVGKIWKPGMMSSVRQDWATPKSLIEILRREFHFRLDVCATPETAVCSNFIDCHQNALAPEREWSPGDVWCNPPYGRAIPYWVERAHRESKTSTIVLLLPARTDTSWFHSYCVGKHEIRFLRGRLQSDDLKGSRAPFPSMLVVMRPEDHP